MFVILPCITRKLERPPLSHNKQQERHTLRRRFDQEIQLSKDIFFRAGGEYSSSWERDRLIFEEVVSAQPGEDEDDDDDGESHGGCHYP